MQRRPTRGTVRSADGTTIAYERLGAGPAVVLVDAAGGWHGVADEARVPALGGHFAARGSS